MGNGELYNWVESPEALDNVTFVKLEENLKEYPYFQTLRLLYQKNLQILRHPRFSSELAKTAFFCADRKRLFYLINKRDYALFLVGDEPKKQVQEDRTQTLIDSFFDIVEEDAKSEEAVSPDLGIGTISYDYLSYLESIDQENAKSENESDKSLLKHHDIIDRFIEKADSNEAFLTRNDNDDAAIDENQMDEIPDNEIDEDKFLTETLAKIYIKQKKYEQALTIIKRLSLNFPKKNAYFADQFIPIFNRFYNLISLSNENVSLNYISQLQDNDLYHLLKTNRKKDIVLGYTTVGIHRDDLEMLLNNFPIKKTGSQGQNKTFFVSMKLAQFHFLLETTKTKPLLLLDDIFDRLDSSRVEEIIKLVLNNEFGQIFISDTNRKSLDKMLEKTAHTDYLLYSVKNGYINQLTD
jgi:hypothetical protein